MAAAAEDMLRLTRWQIGVGIIGTIFLLATLIYNARATKAATRATRVVEMNAHSDRAWMCHSGFRFGYTAGNAGVYLTMTWTNEGLSPALQARLWVGSRVIDDPRADVPVFDIPADVGGRQSIPVGPRKDHYTAPVTFTKEQINDLKNGQLSIFIYSGIRYCDIYEGTPVRQTEICGRLLYTGEQRLDDGSTVPHFELEPIGQQNTAS